MNKHPRRLLAGLALLALPGLGCEEEGASRQKQDPLPPPTWATSALATTAAVPGVGEAFTTVAAADLDGDGDDELIYGGRGLAAIDPDERKLLWSTKFEDLPFSAENAWATGVEAIPSATGDETPDLLVSNSESQLFLVDGATGAVAWSRTVETDLYVTEIALLDADGDGVRDLFPNHTSTAISGATGDELWTAPLWQHATHLAAAKLDDDARGDLLIGLEPPSVIGGWSAAEAGDGQLFGMAADGTELFRFTPAEGRTLYVEAVDLDGDGLDEGVLGTDLGEVFAVDRSGTQLWRTSVAPGGFIDRIAAVDADGDGVEELVVGGGSWDLGYFAARIDADGSVSWLEGASNPVWKLEQHGDSVLVATGNEDLANASGEVFSLSIADGSERWSVETERSIRTFVLAKRGASAELALGLRDAMLRVLDPSTGSEAWTWATGGFVFDVAAADLDGDGADELIRGDDFGYVTVLDRTGKQLRWWRPEVGNAGLITGVVAADLDGDGKPELVATGDRAFQNEMGVVEAIDADGTVRWSVRRADSALDLRAADLDGDGSDELIVAERSVSECSVTAFDGDGSELWKKSMAECMQPAIEVGDVDGDSIPEIAYGAVGDTAVALLSADGSARWQREAEGETAWLALRAGGFVHGGLASATDGFVSVRDAATGDELFRTEFPSSPNGSSESEPFPGWSRFGTLVPDVDGDGVDELAVSSNNGAVYLIDGATGAKRWERRLEPENLPGGEAHHAGPIAWVPGTATGPAYLAVAQSNFVRTDGAIFALDVDGTIVGSAAMPGEGQAIALVHADDRVGALVGAGLGVYAVEAVPAAN